MSLKLSAETKRKRETLHTTMDGTTSPKADSETSTALTPEIQESKKR